jgi:DNA-binding LacI/PurR family transcriptional regulator
MRVTMKDVARAAGVSVTTVSLVLNDAPGIAQATRERVRGVIRDLGYTPNDQARRLFSGRTGTLAFVMPPWPAAFADPYFIEMMRGTLEALRDRGYEMLLEISDARFLEHELWKRLFESKRIDGLLVATPYLDQSYLLELGNPRFPTLLVNGERPDLPRLDFVGYADLPCGETATDYLIGLGHRRIAHISGPANQASALRRAEGYRNALVRAGIPYRADWVQNGEFLPLEGRDALDRILSLPGEKPTAYFCANDTMALSVITHLQERGIRVPEDVSVIGVDDSEAAGRSVPGLTTFRQDMFVLARQAAELFIDKIEGKAGEDPAKVLVPMAFIERGSCAPAPAS